MKTIKVFLIVAVVAIVATVFVACRKNDNNDVANATNPAPVNNYVEPASTPKDYNAYIEELIASTGIDIYEVSKYEGIQRIADKQLKMINAANAANLALQTKSTLTDAKLTQIQNLSATMQSKYNEGNYEDVLVLYESLCGICMTIDGFVLDMNEYGLQDFSYDSNKEPLRLPINQMEAERASAVELIRTIEDRNPQFITLPETTRIDVLTAAVYVSVQQNTIITKQVTGAEDCKKQALNDFTWQMVGVTALYIGAATACAGTLFAVLACEALAYSGFMAGLATSRSLYNARVQLCDKQGYY